MKEDAAIAFYRTTVVALVRTMPLQDAARFLHGALVLAGDHAAMDQVRLAYVSLFDADALLEFAARHPAKLQFGGAS